MKKFLAVLIVTMLVMTLGVSALHHTSADQVMAGSDGHDLAGFGGNNKDGTELGSITETEIIAWGWYSTEVEGGIVEFGYRYGEAVTLGSEKFIGGDAEIIAAQCGGVGESCRFRVTIPVVKGDNVEVDVVASLADGTLDDIWVIKYSAENGIDYPAQPGEPQPAEIHNPEDTTVFWRDDKTNVKHSFDTVYIDGVSQVDLGWGGDGGAHKMITNHPLTVGENVNSTIALRGWAGINNETHPGVQIAEFGYYLNADMSTYVKSGTANPAEQPVVDAGGEYRFENLSINVEGLTEPTLITVVVKGTDGNLYPFGEFSINGAYPGSSEPEGEKDPDQWLCAANADGLTTGWWFFPCGTPAQEPDPANPRYAAFEFTANGAFSGIIGFYFCSAIADGNVNSTLKVELIHNGEVVGEGLASVDGNAWGVTDFGKAYPAGDYTLRYTCYDGSGVENCWNVIGAANVGDNVVFAEANVGGPAGLAPAILLVGAVPPEVEEDPDDKDPNEWLSSTSLASIQPGWWFNPVGGPDGRYVEYTFTSTGAFDGIRGYYYCSNGAVEGLYTSHMTVELIQDGKVLASSELAANGDGWADTDFGKAFKAGEYTLRYTCLSGSGVENTCWCVIGVLPEGNLPVVVDANVSGPESGDPAIMLKGAVPPSEEEEQPLRGDVTGDGKLNNKDVVSLFRYVSSDSQDGDLRVYDFNDDGKVNNKDVVALFRSVSEA
ncbi:MAG: dockerin type I repeat-containing protein [Clostridia bacterium]|nr:dockerin type I repeat-containing protein [Clostridia bacterium]